MRSHELGYASEAMKPLVSACLLCISIPSVCGTVLGQSLSYSPVRAKHGMVASSEQIASQVGLDVLKHGGNAVDAAVAVALALAVTWPGACNLGGGGFMLIAKADGSTTVIDYREVAPLKAHRTVYLDEHGEVIAGASTLGHRAVGVPGTVAGLAYALEKYGTMKWRDVVEPARRLAAQGYSLSYFQAAMFRRFRERLAANPESHRIFLNN